MHLLIFFNLANKFLKTFYIDEVIYVKLLIIETNLTDEYTKIVILVILYDLYEKLNSYSSCMSNT